MEPKTFVIFHKYHHARLVTLRTSDDSHTDY